MLTFDLPAYLSLLFFIIPCIYFNNFYRHRGGVIEFPFKIWQGKSFFPRLKRVRILLGVSEILFWGGTALMIIALAGPSLTYHEKVYSGDRIEIIFALDCSPSMNARDFPPGSRFDAAKTMISKFLTVRKDDPIGLVSFSDNASLITPPTADYEYFMDRLEELSLADHEEGTAIGMGIAVSVLHLSSGNQEGERIIVLMTDGDNNAGEIRPETAAAMAGQLGIKVYTIGIGSEGDVPIQVKDKNSGRIIEGTLRSHFDENMLREISRVTGGDFFRAVTAGTLESVFDTIDSLEQSEKKVSINVINEPLHRYFIITGFILVFAALFIRKIILGEVL